MTKWYMPEISIVVLEGADDLIIAKKCSELRPPEFEQLDAKLKYKVIFEGRNVFDKDKIRSLGYLRNVSEDFKIDNCLVL